MRLTKWVEISQEIEVHVSVAEVMSMIAELGESDQVQMAIDCLNAVHDTVTGMPESVIAKFTAGQRKIISDALRRDAARFDA